MPRLRWPIIREWLVCLHLLKLPPLSLYSMSCLACRSQSRESALYYNYGTRKRCTHEHILIDILSDQLGMRLEPYREKRDDISAHWPKWPAKFTAKITV